MHDASSTPETGDLDHEIFFAIDTIVVGEMTTPIEFKTNSGDIVYKIFQLQSRTSPHRASLQRDYSKILEAARQSKRNEAFNEWVDKKIRETYIEIDDHYEACPNLERWETNPANSEKQVNIGRS